MAATVMTLSTQPHDHGRGGVGVHRIVEESLGTGNRWPTGMARVWRRASHVRHAQVVGGGSGAPLPKG